VISPYLSYELRHHHVLFVGGGGEKKGGRGEPAVLFDRDYAFGKRRGRREEGERDVVEVYYVGGSAGRREKAVMSKSPPLSVDEKKEDADSTSFSTIERADKKGGAGKSESSRRGTKEGKKTRLSL